MLDLFSVSPTEFRDAHREHAANITAILSLLLDKQIVTFEEWEDRRLQCVAEIDQQLADNTDHFGSKNDAMRNTTSNAINATNEKSPEPIHATNEHNDGRELTASPRDRQPSGRFQKDRVSVASIVAPTRCVATLNRRRQASKGPVTNAIDGILIFENGFSQK